MGPVPPLSLAELPDAPLLTPWAAVTVLPIPPLNLSILVSAAVACAVFPGAATAMGPVPPLSLAELPDVPLLAPWAAVTVLPVPPLDLNILDALVSCLAPAK
jgi:hypothetical protein